MVDGKPIQLGLWDTAGQEDYDRLRPLSYPQTDVFLLCFAVSSPESFQNIHKKWYPEIQSHAANVPFVVVGTKTDLRTNPESQRVLEQQGKRPVPGQEGQDLANQLNAYKYVECSALTQDGLKAVFDCAIRCVRECEKKPTKKKSRCLIL